MKLLQSGSWWLKSKIDPRWNSSGRAEVGSFVMPKPCEQKIKELKERLGEPPSDLTWGYMKD